MLGHRAPALPTKIQPGIRTRKTGKIRVSTRDAEHSTMYAPSTAAVAPVPSSSGTRCLARFRTLASRLVRIIAARTPAK